MAQEQPPLILENIHTEDAWKILKAIVVRYKDTKEVPPAVQDVFFTEDPEHLLTLTLSPNPVVAALANSRLLYDGQPTTTNEAP
jgi:hypothetical protein